MEPGKAGVDQNVDLEDCRKNYRMAILQKPSRRQVDPFLEANYPVLLSNLTTEWKATKEWTKSIHESCTQDKKKKLTLLSKTFAGENFARLFGNEMVSLTDCDSILDRSNGSNNCLQMPIFDFLQINGWLDEYQQNFDGACQVKDGNLHSSASSLPFVETCIENSSVPTLEEGNNIKSAPENRNVLPAHTSSRFDSKSSGGATSLYLKDWHFSRKYPDYKAYDVPSCIEDDWLNWWFDNKESYLQAFRDTAQSFCSSNETGGDDFRFVYIGSSNTFTHLHHDVLFSYSWSVNILGRKRWYLFPPEETQKLFDKETGDIFSTDQVLDLIKKQTSGFQPSDSLSLKYVYLEQDPGDILVVPSGWYHIVQNVKGEVPTANDDRYQKVFDSGPIISVNHNWFNSNNILRVWGFLKDEVEEIRTVFQHHKASFFLTDGCYYWENHCEVIMKSNTRINCYEFLILLLMKGIEIKDQINRSKTVSESPYESKCRNFGDDDRFISDTVLPRALHRIQFILNELLLSKSHPYHEHVRAYSLISEKQSESFFEENILSKVEEFCQT